MFESFFWPIYLGILASAALYGLFNGAYKSVTTIADFIISIITWIGLFGYVTNRQILTPDVWKVVFVMGLLWDIYFTFYLSDNYLDDEDELPIFVKYILSIIVFIIFVGPLYYGLYRYSF